MELYTFIELARIFVGLATNNLEYYLIVGAIIGAVLWIAFFALQGVGLYVMAKKRGIKKRALAFVPFANILFIGKLAGECKVFGHKMKGAGLYAMLAQIVATLVTAAYIAAEMYLLLVHGDKCVLVDETYYYWQGLTGFAASAAKFYCDYGQFLMMIFQTVFGILMLIVLMGLFKKYATQNYMLFSFLSLLLPISRFIVIFAVRNNRAIDYDAYVRARQEEYIRRQQYHYGYGPYGDPYRNNPYGAPQPPQPKPEEPFGEFGTNDKKEESPFEEFDGGKTRTDGDGKSDDFFS